MSPLSNSRQKASATALASPSSMVKRWRDQSQLDPSRLSWSMIRSPYSAFQRQTLSRNFSRPSASRSVPSSIS
jgi:hypothetical protein